MPNLDSLTSVNLRGVLLGAYDPKYLVEGLAQPVSQTELFQYLLNNTGEGGSGINDITEGTTDPSGAPGTGEPAVYQNTTTGGIFVWNGSAWIPVVTGNVSGDDDITEGSGIPSGTPGVGEPFVYQNTDNGDIYTWDGSQWNLIGNTNNTGDDDVTEGTGAPSGAPGAGEPSLYQDTDTGNVYVWNGSSWLVLGESEDDITESTGAPSGAPGAGEPLVYQNTVNGNLYVWDSTQWVLVGGGENDITEGAGTPSGAPGVGEPVIYQDTTNGNVYTWDGSQWNIMAVVASNGLTKTGADVELGGTLEKDTDVEVSSFILRMGRLIGNILSYWRIAPTTGQFSLFSRNDSNNEESSLDLLPNSAIIEVDNDTQVGQVSVAADSIGVFVSLSGTVQNRLLVDDEKLELQTEQLIVKTPDSSSATTGEVLTLINATTKEVDFRPAPGSLVQYPAAAVNDPVDDGAFVTANGTGVTYERTGGAGQNTEGILTVPDGVILLGTTVHFSSGQAPGSDFFLNVDYQSTAGTVNTTQDTVIPATGTVSSKPGTFTDGAPATNFVHAGTPLQIGIAQVDDNGTRTLVRYKITNYNQQVGSNASILNLKFA